MKPVRVIAALALAFLSFSAIWGANLLLEDPSGGRIHLPVSVLEHSPFHSFLIPGIVLLVANGLLPLGFTVAMAFRRRGYGLWIAFQGCVLFGWITVEVIMLRSVVWLHYLYWALACLLVGCGWAMHREEKRARSGEARKAAITV